MTGRRSGWRRPQFSAPHDVWTPGEAAQLDALVAACGLVALADGWVTADERRSALDRMRRLGHKPGNTCLQRDLSPR